MRLSTVMMVKLGCRRTASRSVELKSATPSSNVTWTKANLDKYLSGPSKMVPGTFVHTNERCSGHAGTFGVKKPYHEVAMKIGKPLFKRMAEHPQGGAPDYISSDCPLGGHHIDQGFERNALGTPRLQHPLSLLRLAYGLK